MAIAAQGFTIAWGATPLSEIRELSVDRSSAGLPLSRSGAFASNLGSVRLASFAPGQIPDADYGVLRRLTVTAPSPSGTVHLVNQDCVYQDSSVTGSVNEAVVFAYTLRLMGSTSS
jgi:hypothetical protein